MGLPSEATGWNSRSSGGGDDAWWGDDAEAGWGDDEPDGVWGDAEPAPPLQRATSQPHPVVDEGSALDGGATDGAPSRQPWHVSARAMGPLEALMQRCWAEDPAARPSMGESRETKVYTRAVSHKWEQTNKKRCSCASWLKL